jgi:hypothetical protein
MSTYPGENPQSPDDGQPRDAQPVDDAVQDTTEPTQPVGYWERQAAERAQEQPPQVPPTTPYPQNPSGQQQNPYASSGQPAYGGQPAAGYIPPPGQPAPYYYPAGPGAAGPGQPPYGYTPPPPAHPQATLAMVLGLVGVVGAFLACGLTLVVSPFAWAIGQKAVREIRNSNGRLGGESQARTGMITGIVGTVLLVLAIIGVIAFIALVIASDTSSSGGSSI